MESRQPRFAVVSGVLVLLFCFALLVRGLQGFVPAPEAGELRLASGPYLREAARQSIDWRLLDPELFAEARRLDRPVMVVVGASWSVVARLYDRLVFTDPELRVYLNRNYLCARIDVDEQPDWANAILPLRRAETRFTPGFQVWVFEPNGAIFESIQHVHWGEDIDPVPFRRRLQDIRQDMEARRRTEPTGITLAERQSGDRQALLNSAGETPDFVGFLHDLAATGNPVFGGFPMRNVANRTPSYQPLLPHALRYFLITGHTAEFRVLIEPALRSHVVDLIDGGFFRQAHMIDWRGVDLNKTAVSNAEMMALMAQASRTLRDPAYEYLARRTAECLLGEFRVGNWIATARVEDPGYRSRSARSSFPPRRLPAVLTPEQVRWAEVHLRMRVADNEQMIPAAESLDLFRDPPPELGEVLARLRESAEPLTLVEDAYLSTNALVAARLFETARWLGDGDLAREADELLMRLEETVTIRGIRHRLDGRTRDVYLTDYLALTDAHWQRYLALGRPTDLNRARLLLQTAIRYYRTESPLALGIRPVAGQVLPIDLALPQVTDSLGEATTAQAIRLAWGIGLLTEDLDHMPEPSEVSLREWATAAARHFAPLMVQRPPLGAAVVVAAWFCLENTAVLVTGPDAVGMANALSRRWPTRMVIPLGPDVGHPFGDLEPGVHLLVRNEVVGPQEPTTLDPILLGQDRP